MACRLATLICPAVTALAMSLGPVIASSGIMSVLAARRKVMFPIYIVPESVSPLPEAEPRLILKKAVVTNAGAVPDRKSVVLGKSVSERVDLGGLSILNKRNQTKY